KEYNKRVEIARILLGSQREDKECLDRKPDLIYSVAVFKMMKGGVSKWLILLIVQLALIAVLAMKLAP
ncbi:MAG: hypothetical protein Q7U44_05815, partial [Desulfuromonadales bacterium]|nr:hypothetical protein [Desulfuromonadales bacterium]